MIGTWGSGDIVKGVLLHSWDETGVLDLGEWREKRMSADRLPGLLAEVANYFSWATALHIHTAFKRHTIISIINN